MRGRTNERTEEKKKRSAVRRNEARMGVSKVGRRKKGRKEGRKHGRGEKMRRRATSMTVGAGKKWRCN